MTKIQVTLHTGTHCVETEAKTMLRRITGLILETNDELAVRELGEQLELLNEFIGTTDFNKLRASDERYAGIVEAVCILSRGKDGNPVIEVSG